VGIDAKVADRHRNPPPQVLLDCGRAWQLSSAEVIDTLADLFIARGAPGHIRSDQGPESVAEAVKGWIEGVGAKTACIEKASPWEKG
jgi:hypothetical protein